jgi:hypothetical protein
VLGIDDRDDPERLVDLTPLDRGSLIHLVLERFLGEILDQRIPEPDEPWSTADRRRLAQLADEAFAEVEAAGRTGRRLRWQFTRRRLHAELQAFLDADEAHRRETRSWPERVEFPFGLDGAEPVVLELADGRSLAFRGRADRLDRTADGRLLVFDYKTGNARAYRKLATDDPVSGGTTLQLGLYAEAGLQLLGAESASAHYWMVGSRGDGQRHGYAWTDERRHRLLEVVEAIVAGIDAGVFAMVPGEPETWRNTHESCVYCAFDRVCPRNRGEQARAKSGSPELAVRIPLTTDWTPETDAVHRGGDR